MSPDHDDSAGKRKGRASRSAGLSAAFVLGLCLGIVVSERLYILHKESEVEPSNALEAVSARKLRLRDSSTKGGVDAAVSERREASSLSQGKPRNELEATLRKVAPQGEVLIAISNYNLVREGALNVWIDCVERIPSKNWLVVAIDEALRDYCKENKINYYYRPVVVGYIILLLVIVSIVVST
jgi:arabinosyltransferase